MSAPASVAQEKDGEAEEIVVTGERRVMQQSMETKRDAVSVIDHQR